MQETTLSLPFLVDSYGKLATTTDQKKIWSDRVRSVLGTNLRERLMRPEFGCLVPSAFMETQETASATIETEVDRAFSTQLSSLTLKSVDTVFGDGTGDVNITISYSLPNNELIDTTVSFMYIQNDQPAYEVNL